MKLEQIGFPSLRQFAAIALSIFTSFGFINSGFAEVEKQPKASLSTSAYSFGAVTQGTKVTTEVILKNDGDGDLVLNRTVPACGCTVASSLKDKIPPGQATTIKVELDTTGFSGPQEKLVRIFTNDPVNAALNFTLKGEVKPQAIVEPARVVFPEIIRGESKNLSQEFVVSVSPGSPALISEVSTLSKFIKIEELEKGDKRRRVRVTLDEELPPGEFRDRIVVNMLGASVSALNVPVWATIKGVIRILPSSVSFGIVQGTKLLEKQLDASAVGKGQISIKEVLVSDPEILKASLSVKRPGRSYVVKVTVDPTKVKQELRGTVTVVTDSNTEPKIAVPVYGILPPALR